MPKNIAQYDLLISCPGDISTELQVIKDAVEKFNTMFTDSLGISIRTKHWSKNSYAQSGGKPQELLNKQFVNDCDAAVALFWTKFGTPTDQYGSGTEEEIEIMLRDGKQVFMYFSDKPLPPSQHNPNGYQQILDFRKKYKDRGIYFTYTSDEELAELFFAHLTQHFMTVQKVTEIREERNALLSIKGIDGKGHLTDNVIVHPFSLMTDRTSQKDFKEISTLFEEISQLHCPKTPKDLRPLMFATHQLKEVPDDVITYITEAAKHLNIELSEDFFEVGDLRTEMFSVPSIMGGPKYIGTENEKKKIYLLYSLKDKIIDMCNWIPVENGFQNLYCIKLALANTGSNIDNDIDVTIRMPKASYRALNELSKLKYETMEYLVSECNMKQLFTISKTKDYLDYESSIEPSAPNTSFHYTSPLYSTTDYEEDYIEDMEDIFCYDVYDDDDCYVINLKFDYIKHHTIVAFPTPLFIKNTPTEISYSITSQNSATIIEGILEVI